MSINTSRVDLSKIEPAFLDDVIALVTGLDAALGTFYITCGDREWDTEEIGYHAWLADHTRPKYTDPADSAHVGANFPDGLSRAVDFTLVRDGKDIWEVDDHHPTDPGWVALVAAVLAHPRLHGLVSIGDYDHVEQWHWQADRTPTA